MEEIIEMLIFKQCDRYQESIAAVNFTFCLPLSYKCFGWSLSPQQPGCLNEFLCWEVLMLIPRGHFLYIPLHVFKQGEGISLTIMCDLGLNKPYPQF